jgi:hypothetical protein
MTDFWHLLIYVHNSKSDNHCGRGYPSGELEKIAPLSPSNILKNKNRLFRKRSYDMACLIILIFSLVIRIAYYIGAINFWEVILYNIAAFVCITSPTFKHISSKKE